MRILILLKRWPGGVGSAMRSVKKELELKGHYVRIISREEDLELHSMIGSILKIRGVVKSSMRKENFDVIYTQDWSMAFPLIFPFFIFKRKHFCCFHGIQNGSGRIFQRIVAKVLGKKLIVVGPTLKKRFPLANLFYNGVDVNLMRPMKGIKKIIGSVGFANWRNKNYRFKDIKKAVKNLDKKLIVAENLSPEKMPGFYNSLETLLSLPPKFAGFGLVWLEAMACGVPKIIGNKYGIGGSLPIDHVEDYKNLEEAIKNSKKKDYRRLLKKEFEWKNHVKKLLEVWRGC